MSLRDNFAFGRNYLTGLILFFLRNSIKQIVLSKKEVRMLSEQSREVTIHEVKERIVDSESYDLNLSQLKLTFIDGGFLTVHSESGACLNFILHSPSGSCQKLFVKEASGRIIEFTWCDYLSSGRSASISLKIHFEDKSCLVITTRHDKIKRCNYLKVNFWEK